MTLLEWLYDPTPITSEWLVECGGCQSCGTYSFGDWNWTMQITREGWKLAANASRCYISTRGDLRRACELLGIATTEVRPEDDRLALEKATEAHRAAMALAFEASRMEFCDRRLELTGLAVKCESRAAELVKCEPSASILRDSLKALQDDYRCCESVLKTKGGA